MRIISQDGMRDAPYDGCRMECDTDDVSTLFYGFNESMRTTNEEATYDIYVASIRVGSYKSKERALEVMEAIRRQYADNESWKLGVRSGNLKPFTPCYQMPKDEEKKDEEN